MQFDRPQRKTRPESIVPMINVVFLLLVFFLMTAELRPAPPVEVALPEAAGAPADAAAGLIAAADGTLAFGDLRGEAALAAAAASPAPLTLRADRDLPGADLARLRAALAALGQGRVLLVTGLS